MAISVTVTSHAGDAKAAMERAVAQALEAIGTQAENFAKRETPRICVFRA